MENNQLMQYLIFLKNEAGKVVDVYHISRNQAFDFFYEIDKRYAGESKDETGAHIYCTNESTGGRILQLKIFNGCFDQLQTICRNQGWKCITDQFKYI